MVGIRQTTMQATLTFTAAPADVASAVEAALASVGKVQDADPQTGRISGKVKGGLKGWEESAHIDILISGSGDATKVDIQTAHDEGAISMNGAQKTMDAFLDALRTQPGVAGKGSSGW